MAIVGKTAQYGSLFWAETPKAVCLLCVLWKECCCSKQAHQFQASGLLSPWDGFPKRMQLSLHAGDYRVQVNVNERYFKENMQLKHFCVERM